MAVEMLERAPAQTICDEICLPFCNAVDRAQALLKREELVEVGGSHGFGELAYHDAITPKGIIRVHQLRDRTTYTGPAPVTLEQYRAVIKVQAIADVRVGPGDVRRALADLVLEEHVIDAIGQAVTPDAPSSASARRGTGGPSWRSTSPACSAAPSSFRTPSPSTARSSRPSTSTTTSRCRRTAAAPIMTGASSAAAARRSSPAAS